MTLQQEAIQLINSMPDDRIRIIIELLHFMEPKAEIDKEIEKMNALRWMQKRHAEMADDMYASIDFDKEREEALAEKYGYSG